MLCHITLLVESIFRRVEKLAKATISFVMSVCLSAHLHGLEGFSLSFILLYFLNNSQENSSFIRILKKKKKNQVHYMKTYVHLW
jgi:hypothetical protein